MLDTTSGELEDNDQEYDSYHDESCYEVTTVIYQGERISCNSNRLEDFILLNGEYYHEDDITSCPHCGDRFVIDNGIIQS